MNEEMIQETRIPHKEALKYFTRVGLAVLLMFVVREAVANLAVYIIEAAAPGFVALVRDGTYWWFNWLLSIIPLYFFGLPVFLLVLPKAPAPVGEKQRLGVGKFVSVSFSTAAGTYILNLVGILILTLLWNISGGLLGGTDNSALSKLLNSSPMWMIFIVVCIVAPIGEEFIFRKLLIDRLKPFGELNACLFSGLMFGLFHGNLNQFLYAFAIGFIFATVYVKTNNIIYTMVLHFGVNFFGSVVSVWLSSKLEWYTEAVKNMTNLPTEEMVKVVLFSLLVMAFGLLVFGSVVAGIVLFILYIRKLKFERPVMLSERDNSEFWKNPGAIMTIVVLSCVILRELVNLPK